MIILPVFLFSSRHIKNDIPVVIAQAKSLFPYKKIDCADSMKSSGKIVELAKKRIFNSCFDLSSEDTLLVVGRGSSDPDSNAEFEKMVRLIGEACSLKYILSGVVGITFPRVEERLELISRLRPKRLIIFPYFLFHGRLIDQLWDVVDEFKKTHPWIEVIKSSELGLDKILISYFKEHVERILRGDDAKTLVCITCHYRPEMKDLATRVKGVNALLWSVRHMYTHSQAKPHEYPHASVKKHVLICENIDCANKGSKLFARSLRKYIKNDGKGRDD